MVRNESDHIGKKYKILDEKISTIQGNLVSLHHSLQQSHTDDHADFSCFP